MTECCFKIAHEYFLFNLQTKPEVINTLQYVHNPVSTQQLLTLAVHKMSAQLRFRLCKTSKMLLK
jgi:hypothetical protein